MVNNRRSIPANTVHSTQVSAHASNNAVNIHVPTFDGDGELVEFFFSQIEDLIKVNNWSNDHAVLFLKSKLSGAALKFYIQSPELKHSPDFDVIKRKFCSFFAPSTTTNYDFNSLKFEKNETILSFAHRLDVSFRKLYPNIDNETALEQIKIVKFIDAMPFDVKVKLYELNSKSFNENVQKAENLVNCHAMASSSKFKADNNVCNTSIIEKLNALEAKLENLASERVESVNFARNVENPNGCDKSSRSSSHRPRYSDRRSFPIRPTRLTCRFCRKVGHVEARCFRKKNWLDRTGGRQDSSQNFGRNPRTWRNQHLNQNAAPFVPRNSASGN